MGLKDVLEEQKAALAKAQEAEASEIEREASREPEPKPEPKPEPAPEAEKPADEVQAEPELAKKTPADHAKERREKRAREEKLAQDLAEANAHIAELSRKPEPAAPVEDPEPNKLEDREGWLEWKANQLEKKTAAAEKAVKEIDSWKQQQERKSDFERTQQAADRELTQYEQQARQTRPDFEEVKVHYVTKLADAIQTINPNLTREQLVKAVQNRFMQEAAEYLNQGYENPLEPMYEKVKASGFKPRAEEPEGRPEIKPDLKKIAANKNRSSSMVGADGAGGDGIITMKSAATMKNKDWVKLPAEQRRKILKGG